MAANTSETAAIKPEMTRAAPKPATENPGDNQAKVYKIRAGRRSETREKRASVIMGMSLRKKTRNKRIKSGHNTTLNAPPARMAHNALSTSTLPRPGNILRRMRTMVTVTT
jgi:hypothetical protein